MSAPIDGQHIDTTFGAAYIGVVAAAMLYGVSFVQTCYYFLEYRQDVWFIKALVGAICIFETIHQALISHTVYYYLITNYNNPGILNNIVWSILLEVLFNGLIGLLVQGFLTLRVWRCRSMSSSWFDFALNLSVSGRNVPLTIAVATLVFACFGCSVAFTAQSMQLDTWVELEQLKGLSMAINLLGAATDITIAAALFVFLHKSRTGFKKSDTMISRLIAFTVSTGLLTSICAVASLISILASGDTLIYVAFYFSLGRLYSNSVLATLNARQIIRKLGEDSDELSFSLQSASKAGHGIPSTAVNMFSLLLIDTNTCTKHEFNRDRERQDTTEDLAEPESAITENSF
ncbi:hypothetical protein GALMADRAFT_132917 [Galerina marginata CBS 339.88]|uniref:DUF6534 domain-containing protein n=1 Tax=Galerina marginata (strain CBS 339.88) TaxID=685588 RepID=A0A067TME1_GALM3|nr:hypothetical protein GALMADRAFT_132917 [Galerina marginata CBS 339.88]